MAKKSKIHSLIMNRYLYALIFVIGAIAFLYPLITGMINMQAQTRVISNYETEMRVLQEAEKQKLHAEAESYNRFVAALEGNVTDEMTPEEKASTEVVYMGVISTGEAIGSVEIPTIEVKAPVFRGTSEDVLSQGIGHLERSSLPIGGVSTHAVLSGHRGLPSARLFRDLGMLEAGDIFLLNTLDETLAYEVESITIVLPYEVESLRIQEGRDLCTLVTCDPYMINSHRMLVTGHRIDYSPDGVEAAREDSISFFEKYIEYFIIASTFIALAIIAWLIRRLFTKRGTITDSEGQRDGGGNG